MADMLVKLYDLPPLAPALERAGRSGVLIRRANAWELTATRSFIEQRFTVGWADETSVGFSSRPITVMLAVKLGVIVGFAAYECTRRGFFGPTGVDEKYRGGGIGTALLLASLHGLAELGYAYGIIGGVGPAEFYAAACGAVPIANSTPGIYRDLLIRPPVAPPAEAAATEASDPTAGPPAG